MPSVQYLREFVNERLTAATEEILGVFVQTVRVYEEEIDRQRKLLDIVLKPEIKLHRTGLIGEGPSGLLSTHSSKGIISDEIPQSLCNDKVLADQQLCNQERSSSLDQEDPELPLIKEEQEEQLLLEQESQSFQFRPSGYSEDHTLLLPLTDISVKVIESESDTEGSGLLEPNSDHPIAHNSHRAESKDCEIGNQENARADQTAEKKHFKCLVCAKGFHSILELKLHERTHSSDKLFKCEICGKVFTRKERVIRHMNIHTGAKPYRCRVCGKEFNCQSNCAAHMKTHTGEKPHICFTCGKSFSLAKNLKRHIRSHTGEKPYSCVHCGRRFSNSSHLTTHIRVHTGEKPYSCAWCGKRFAVNSTLKIHTRLHTGEKPYECNICGRNFTQKTSLRLHKRIHVEKTEQS